MNLLRFTALCLWLLLGSKDRVLSQNCNMDAIVAQDGSGDYTSIQEAIDAAPDHGTGPYRIFIKNGIYTEKLFFEKSFITLIGEEREKTVITAAILRRAWREENPDDWGAATVNIRNQVTDLTFANLTIQNNFAEVFPDFPNNNDHSFAIRGGGHRIILLNCTVVATGGDTLSLWNTDGGMFYHNNCYFEGYVDYVAPRGYCYITESEFFGYNSTASIWHDGSGGEDHKLVIRRSNFDGKPGFALGRHHRDAQFYLLDCFFSENMKNQKIYWEGRDEIQWGPERIYYYNTHRPVFDWPWHRDNLHDAPGAPDPEDITASWTFNREWDPESQLDGLLPFAFLPSPSNKGCSSLEPVLTWASGRCVSRHLVYFGKKEKELSLVSSQDSSLYYPADLEENSIYFWRVDEVTDKDTITGPLWQFRTEKTVDLSPNPGFNPEPENGAAYFTRLVRLGWDFDPCTADSFYVYFGEKPEQLSLRSVEKYGAWYAAGLKNDSTYYWRVDAKNEFGVTQGEVWSFTLNPSTTSVNQQGQLNFKFDQNYPNPSSGKTYLNYRIPETDTVLIQLSASNGSFLKTLQAGKQAAGSHLLEVDISTFSGLLLCTMTYQGQSRTVRIIAQ